MGPVKKNNDASQILKRKPGRKVKVGKNSRKKKQSKDLQELARTWDEDLCE